MSEPSEKKLCPFRGVVNFLGTQLVTEDSRESVFGTCLEEKCAMWRKIKEYDSTKGMFFFYGGHCGLAGKP